MMNSWRCTNNTKYSMIWKKNLWIWKDPESMDKKELEKLIKDVEKRMKKAAAELDFESAAELRDKMVELKDMLNNNLEK